MFSWPRGLARRSVLAHRPHSLDRVTPTNPVTNRPGHTHSSSHCNRLPHTQSHIYLWVFWFCSVWVFNFTGSVLLHPPPFCMEFHLGAFTPCSSPEAS